MVLSVSLYVHTYIYVQSHQLSSSCDNHQNVFSKKNKTRRCTHVCMYVWYVCINVIQTSLSVHKKSFRNLIIRLTIYTLCMYVCMCIVQLTYPYRHSSHQHHYHLQRIIINILDVIIMYIYAHSHVFIRTHTEMRIFVCRDPNNIHLYGNYYFVGKLN